MGSVRKFVRGCNIKLFSQYNYRLIYNEDSTQWVKISREKIKDNGVIINTIIDMFVIK